MLTAYRRKHWHECHCIEQGSLNRRFSLISLWGRITWRGPIPLWTPLHDQRLRGPLAKNKLTQQRVLVMDVDSFAPFLISDHNQLSLGSCDRHVHKANPVIVGEELAHIIPALSVNDIEDDDIGIASLKLVDGANLDLVPCIRRVLSLSLCPK